MFNMYQRWPALVILGIQLLCSCPILPFAAAVDYLQDVKPLLEHKCYACHGTLKQQSGLRLDTAQSIHAGGDSGAVIDLASPQESLLLEVIRGESSLRMPPENEGSPLTAEEVAVVRAWIEAGAPIPAHEDPPADPRSWWSYLPIVSPPIPKTADPSWCRNPIDSFIADQRDQQRLQPAPPATKATWLRRVYLDLIGLPPTRQQLHAFLSDPDPSADQQVVERLLASPQYGQRWGRHWMDVWRYSDWYGSRGSDEIRYSQRHIWRWRDWIVHSLNSGRSYADMLREMLAADELLDPDTDEVSLAATGYLGRNWYKFDRDVWLFDTVERTSEALLGITMRCCRCHDHKFDPISQEDYYRLRAFFEPHDVRTQPLSELHPAERIANSDQKNDSEISFVFDRDLAAPTYRFERGDPRFPDKSQPLAPGVPPALQGTTLTISSVELPLDMWYPALRDSVRQSSATEAAAAVQAALDKYQETHLQQASAAANLVNRAQQSAELEQNATNAVGPDKDAKPNQDSELPTVESLQAQLTDAKRNRWLALAEVHVARANQRSLEGRMVAEVAKYIDRDESSHTRLALRASELERAATLRTAEVAVAQAALNEPSMAVAFGPICASSVGTPSLLHTTSDIASTASGDPADEAVFKAQLVLVLKLAEAQLMPGESLVSARKKLAAIQSEQASVAKADTYSPLGPQYPPTSTGRRTALADWITSRENVRTARVAANHLWKWHFGQPLVATPENFGLNGRQPTHPALLDWLAQRLMAEDWQLKPLHRLIVLSSTYRMDSSGGPDMAGNQELAHQFFAQMPSRRMEAEVIRDSILDLARQLDCSLGGPELDESAGEVSSRRSLYFRNTPNEKMPLLEVFDMADPNGCYRRQASVVPHQSLALMNSGLALDNSKLIAAQLTTELTAKSTVTAADEANSREKPTSEAASSDGAAEFIEAAFETVLTRVPTPAELQRCLQFLDEQAALDCAEGEPRFAAGGTAKKTAAVESALRARENLIHVLFLHNDFVTIR